MIIYTSSPAFATNAMSSETPELGTTVLDDAELIRKAKQADNGRRFSLLFEKGWSSTAVRRFYQKPRHARLALLNYLGWWSRQDTSQMWRLFQDSALCPDDISSYRAYFEDLVRSVRSLLGSECYDPHYHSSTEGESQ